MVRGRNPAHSCQQFDGVHNQGFDYAPLRVGPSADSRCIVEREHPARGSSDIGNVGERPGIAAKPHPAEGQDGRLVLHAYAPAAIASSVPAATNERSATSACSRLPPRMLGVAAPATDRDYRAMGAAGRNRRVVPRGPSG